MLPTRVLETFSRLPAEIVGLCRPQTWEDLTTSPQPGMRPIRDALAHMIGTEVFWILHIIRGKTLRRRKPEFYESLDGVLRVWVPQRETTAEFVRTLTPAKRRERRRLPWDATQSASVEEIVWHVVTHEQYHRGQIFTRLALLGRRDLPDYDILRDAAVRPVAKYRK